MWLPEDSDTVSADGARLPPPPPPPPSSSSLPWVARLGQARPAHHLGLISAPRQQTHVTGERRISVKHDVIDILVIEVAPSHLFLWYFGSFLLLLLLPLFPPASGDSQPFPFNLYAQACLRVF